MSKENPKVTFKVADADRNIWLLENVRVSFPNLWRPGKYEGAEKPNLDTSFLIPKDQKDVVKAISTEMVKLARTINGKIKKPSQIKHLKFLLPRGEDGKPKGNDYVLKTSNTFDYPPVYIDENGKRAHDPIAAGAESKLYGGCYARIKVQMNPDTVGGKVKIWSNLVAIQFMAHGERLGSALSDDELSDGFGEVEVDDDFSKAGSEDEFEDDLDDDIDDDEDDEFDDDDFDLDDDD